MIDKGHESDRPRFLFVYGSLIHREARLTTVPAAGTAYPVLVRGLRRGWWLQYGPELGPTLSPTYLGAEADPDATCNGVVFSLSAHPDKLEALSWREQGYVLTALKPADVEIIDGDIALDDAEIWYYASPERSLPSRAHPIVQSYVDECVIGCLEIEDAFPLARQMSFARQFLESTDAWQAPWVNDRLQPWRPSKHTPRAWDVDELLHDVLGPDLFAQIKVPGY